MIDPDKIDWVAVWKSVNMLDDCDCGHDGVALAFHLGDCPFRTAAVAAKWALEVNRDRWEPHMTFYTVEEE